VDENPITKPPNNAGSDVTLLASGLAKCGGCIRERGAGWEKPASEPANNFEEVNDMGYLLVVILVFIVIVLIIKNANDVF